MDDYFIIKELGNGSFGTVIQAQHKQTGQVVSFIYCFTQPDVSYIYKVFSFPW